MAETDVVDDHRRRLSFGDSMVFGFDDSRTVIAHLTLSSGHSQVMCIGKRIISLATSALQLHCGRAMACRSTDAGNNNGKSEALHDPTMHAMKSLF